MEANHYTVTDVCDAYAMAATAHRDQLNEKGQPYLYHVLRVATAVRKHGPAHEIVGMLHDSVEDTDLTIGEVERRFGEVIARSVDAMTRREGEVYFKEYLPRVLANPIARQVKFADSSDNLAQCLADGDVSRAKRYRRVLSTIQALNESEQS